VLLNRGTTTPVMVEDLEATATDGGVQLRWRLSAEARRDLRDITVERATAADGPYALCSVAQLAPAPDMSFEDTGLKTGSYWYRLVLVSLNGSRALAGPVGVEVGSGTPRITALHQPFAPAAGGPIQIRYGLAGSRMLVQLGVYDVRGRVVWRSERSVRDPGEYTQTWDRRDRSGAPASRGIYFVRLEAGGVSYSKKLSLLER